MQPGGMMFCSISRCELDSRPYNKASSIVRPDRRTKYDNKESQLIHLKAFRFGVGAI